MKVKYIPQCPICHSSSGVGGLTKTAFFCSECSIEFSRSSNNHDYQCYRLNENGEKVGIGKFGIMKKDCVS